MNHELVPKHQVVTQEEKVELLKKFGIRLSQLPKILSTDPIIIAIGARPGDVVKITRNSTISNEVTTYRFVVEV